MVYHERARQVKEGTYTIMKKQAFQGGGQVNICLGEWRQEPQVMVVVATQVCVGGLM